jgi:hypothetical protein
LGFFRGWVTDGGKNNKLRDEKNPLHWWLSEAITA